LSQAVTSARTLQPGQLSSLEEEPGQSNEPGPARRPMTEEEERRKETTTEEAQEVQEPPAPESSGPELLLALSSPLQELSDQATAVLATSASSLTSSSPSSKQIPLTFF